MRVWLAVLVIVNVASEARADIAVPNQELCTVEIQQRDGSRCEGCTWHGPEQGAYDRECAGPLGRGWTRRCGYGATVASAVFCDREADWLEVGGARETPAALDDDEPVESGGCGCRATGSRRPLFGGVALVALLASIGRRRR